MPSTRSSPFLTGADSNVPFRIVGVVDHVKQYRLDDSEGEKPQIYYSFYQLPDDVVPIFRAEVTSVVRTATDTPALLPAIRAAASEVGGDQPVYNIHSMRELVSGSMSRQRFTMLLLGSWGGLIVDRVDKRRLLYVTQSASGVLALALGILVALGTITMWEVYLISTLFGFVNLFDNPARQTFVSEMVGRDLMPNAISLNSVVMNSARVIGPAIGGILIYAVGLAACFLVNAASYVAVLVALFMMRPAELHQRPDRADRVELRPTGHFMARSLRDTA